MENGVSYPLSQDLSKGRSTPDQFEVWVSNRFKAGGKHFSAQFGHFISNEHKLIRNLSAELKQNILKIMYVYVCPYI